MTPNALRVRVIDGDNLGQVINGANVTFAPSSSSGCAAIPDGVTNGAGEVLRRPICADTWTVEAAFTGYEPSGPQTIETIDGEEVRRPYSICTTPHGGLLGVGIKHVEGGRFSTHALANLAIGDSLDVMTPQGRFVHADQNDDVAGDILLLAAGSGITPILSIAETALATGHPRSRVTLVYGNRNSTSIMFRDRVEDLKDRYLDRCRVLHVLSREPRDADLLNGRVDAGKVAVLVDAGLITPA
ncbi:MAG: FAD-binding oxidoreductase, partial [Pseudomonadota bacterium]|nr:FAD-binding oxidoreductase [Pseudomonadota bacterium]